MKRTINHPDGRIETLEGTPEELARYAQPTYTFPDLSDLIYTPDFCADGRPHQYPTWWMGIGPAPL